MRSERRRSRRSIPAAALLALALAAGGRPCLYVGRDEYQVLATQGRGKPATTPEGRLDPCLRCDEDRSGPVFKAVAGRTRRDSGIRSSIPRPDEEVAHVVHDYVPGVVAPPSSALPR